MPTADIYRMTAPVHMCPSGQKALHLLKKSGFTVQDHPLPTRPEVDAFKAQHDVKTTPQVFIDGTRIGGYDDLRAHLGLAPARPTTPTYRPIIALFGMAAAMAIAIQWATMASMPGMGGMTVPGFLVAFGAVSMCLLSLQKLRDLEGFTSTFLIYDLLARRWLPYAYIYPFLEGISGLLMLAMALHWLSAPIAIFIGGIGGWSVYRAVYIEKRKLKCACVGGGSNVPLGAVSLLENLGMVAMGIWMLLTMLP